VVVSVRQLEGDAAAGPLRQLLLILCEKGVQEFDAFAAQHAALFSAHGLSQEELSRNIGLVAVGGVVPDEILVPYGAVARVLGIAEEAVEVWMVQAISEGLVEARMNRFNKTIDVM